MGFWHFGLCAVSPPSLLTDPGEPDGVAELTLAAGCRARGASLLPQHVRSHDAAEARVECAGVFFAFHAGTHAIADTVLIAAHE